MKDEGGRKSGLDSTGLQIIDQTEGVVFQEGMWAVGWGMKAEDQLQYTHERVGSQEIGVFIKHGFGKINGKREAMCLSCCFCWGYERLLLSGESQ